MSNAPYSGQALWHGAWQFLTGKAISAFLTFSILIWLVRMLSVEEYGVYIILVAGMELCTALASVGLPWLATRYLPEYRLHASGVALASLCRQLLACQALSLLFLIALLAALLDAYLAWVELERYLVPAQIYLAVLLFEGLGRFLREALMGPLMLQREVRSSMVLRQFIFFVFIAALDFTNHGVLLWVVQMELIASILAMIFAFTLLYNHLQVLRAQLGQPGWFGPTLATQWHIAGRMYAALLLTLIYSPQLLVSLIQRALGIEVAALFGFLSALQGQVYRYLPATLLSSLIRPMLIANYVGGGSMAELNRNANLAGKLSLFALMPIVALAAMVGDPLVTWLSGDKFANSGWLLLGFMLTLVPYSQRQLIESVAVASGHAGLCSWGALSGLFMLPLMWLILQSGMGLWAAIIAIALGHLLFNIIVIVGVSKQAEYQTDWVGFAKLMVSILFAYGVGVLLRFEVVNTWPIALLPEVLQCVLVMFVYIVVTWWIKLFSTSERASISAFVRPMIH